MAPAMEAEKRCSNKLSVGCNTVGKVVVAGTRGRASGKVRTTLLSDTKAITLQSFVAGNAIPIPTGQAQQTGQARQDE